MCPPFSHSAHARLSTMLPLLLLTLLLTSRATNTPTSAATLPPQTLRLGFTSSPDPSITTFQPLLVDPTNNFSLAFLRLDGSLLALAVVHVPSAVPLWQPRLAATLHWSKRTSLVFNGSLIIRNDEAGVVWTSDTTNGDHVSVTNGSNLQILGQTNGGSGPVVLWQSFDFPYDTIVENQNLTSDMELVSSNELYVMKLGADFIGFYARFNGVDGDRDQIYYMHRALQAKADVEPGGGPIYVRVSSDGYLGMYQNGSVPVDIQSFNSYQRSVPGIRRMRMGSDGDLKGYYWAGSEWVLDYQAITEPCDLPSACGPFGLCTPGAGSDACSCLDSNKTKAQPGDCSVSWSGDFCGAQDSKTAGFRVLRKAGVELPYKELMGYIKTTSLGQCETLCAQNCSCWGAVYNNGSGFCYTLDYPVQTVVEVSDLAKVGYFKLRESTTRKNKDTMIGILCGFIAVVVVIVVVVGGIWCWGSRAWKRKRRESVLLDEEKIDAPGPYKDLGSVQFATIELSSR